MRTVVHLSLCLTAILASCGSQGAPARPTQVTEGAPPAEGGLSLPTPASFAAEHGSFSEYWHQGKAELSRYRLSQARYGGTHEGEAVLIFVTEPFLPVRQVKDESGQAPDAVPVLKLNHYRRFYTGIYPYTILTSSFTPEASGPALKLSSSVQEWCGHAYMQLNRRGGQLELDAHSYFEAEADQERTMPEVGFEDALFTMLRRDPAAVPTGTIELLPGLHYLRMRHQPARAYAATAERDETVDERFGGAVGRYRVRYPELRRTLTIYFGTSFPHAIMGWEEDGPEGHTEAIRTHAILDAYWAHNGASDDAYRRALGLSE